MSNDREEMMTATFRIPVRLKNEIKRIAQERDRSINYILIKLLDQKIEELKAEQMPS